MGLIEIITTTIAATSMMTVFSYVISESFQKLYKEPVLLEFLMSSFHFELTASQKKVAAWCVHYLVGLLFAIIYYLPVILEYALQIAG